MTNVINITEESLEAALSIDRCVFAFTAAWCEPCKKMYPVSEEIGKTYCPVYQIDIVKFPKLAQAFGVKSVPTFHRVSRGKSTSAATGVMSFNALVARLGLQI